MQDDRIIGFCLEWIKKLLPAQRASIEINLRFRLFFYFNKIITQIQTDCLIVQGDR